jgi:hypothetical protein
MENEFVTYEQALALKELGFDESCFGVYSEHDKTRVYDESAIREGLKIQAPLYQQAFRWFREKHNLVFNFISYNIVKPGEYHWSITWNDEAKASGIVKTYEEAEQACLDKLIEICKNK